MPLLGTVVVGGGVYPITETHAYVSAQRPVHFAPARGFQVKKSLTGMPALAAMVSQFFIPVDEVEFVVVAHHLRLDWSGCLDAFEDQSSHSVRW